MKIEVLKPEELINKEHWENHPNRYFSNDLFDKLFLFYVLEIEGTYINCFIHIPKNLVFLEVHKDKSMNNGTSLDDYMKSTLPFTYTVQDTLVIDSEGKSKKLLAMNMLQQIMNYTK